MGRSIPSGPQSLAADYGSMDDLDGIAAADAHLGRPVPLPAVALPLTRWSRVHAVSAEGVEIEWNLDDSRAGAPGRLALYVGYGPPPQPAWPGGGPPRPGAGGGGAGAGRHARSRSAT